jgi:hypothetical protein
MLAASNMLHDHTASHTGPFGRKLHFWQVCARYHRCTLEDTFEAPRKTVSITAVYLAIAVIPRPKTLAAIILGLF